MNDLNSFSKNKPIDTLKVRGINLAVWAHGTDEKSYRQITIKKFFKDQESGEIKESKSMSIYDIPFLIQQLQEVYSKELRGSY